MENKIKRVTVEFDYDQAEDVVSNLTCFINGVEKKKTTTRAKKEEKPVVLEDTAIITLDATKLYFNNKAAHDMNLQYEDRVVIKYNKINGSKFLVPIIGKDCDQGSEGSGNKVTKAITVSYRGKANTILAEHGTEFTIKQYKEGLWEMVSLNEGVKVTPPPTYKSVEKDAEKLDVTVFTDDDDMTEIGDMSFIL